MGFDPTSHVMVQAKPFSEFAVGDVYRARDTKLGREVSLKVLPEAFAGDEERLSRF